MNELLLRRRNKAIEKEYFHFADPEVERIVISNIGDGTGVTLQQIQACTSIGTWFRGNTTIVTFDEFEEFINVTSLSSTGTAGAFSDCSSLVSIKTPPNLHNLPQNTFRRCSALVNLTFGSYVTQANAANYVFDGCTSLANVYYPSLSDLCSSSFGGTTGWGHGVFASSTATNRRIYVGDTELVDIVIPSNITSIGGVLFIRANCIRSLTITGEIAVGSYAFSDSSLVDIDFGDNPGTIGNYAFYRNTSLNSLTGLRGITSIGRAAFCSQRTSGTYIPVGDVYLENIVDLNVGCVDSSGSFAYQMQLGTLIVGDKCQTIAKNLCYRSNVSQFIVLATTPPTITGSMSAGTPYVPYSADHSILAAYQNAWGSYYSTINELPEGWTPPA